MTRVAIQRMLCIGTSAEVVRRNSNTGHPCPVIGGDSIKNTRLPTGGKMEEIDYGYSLADGWQFASGWHKDQPLRRSRD